MRVFVFLALCIAAVAAVPSNPQRIVGGSTTTISQYPSMVALLYSRTSSGPFSQACGGTLLNNRSVLTAAHCTIGDGNNNWRVRVGSTNANSGGVVHNLNRILNHPNYNFWTMDNDIALLHTSTNVAHNNNVSPASIPGTNYNVGDNQVVWATGWGRISQGGPTSEQLRHVQLWTVNQATCRSRYATVGHAITDNMMCSGWLDVGGRDQCQGDSGGPLYHNINFNNNIINVVVGVYSFGQGCAQAYYPGVNARVSRYTSWIQSNA